MERVEQAIAARGVGELFRAGTAAGMSDAELLGRFATRRGDAAELAFGALVVRHGPMVLRVCRGVLRDPHDAEDAFQATFLVLVRRAGSLWVRDSLGPWLHQTAYRTACFARTAEARRRRHEASAADSAGRTVEDDAGRDDFAGVVHEEIARLPDRFRAAVVLCLLEGRTPEQAAGHLGCPVGTVHSRLARGRERLRSRLTDRGVAVPAALLAATSTTTVSPALAEAVVRAAMGTTTHPGAAVVIASAVLDARTHPAARALPASALKLAAAVLSAGLVVVAIPRIGASTAGRPQDPPRESEVKSRDAESPPNDRPRAAEKAKAVAPGDDSRDFVAYAPDGETFAVASVGGTVSVWDAATGERRLTFTHWRKSILGLAFSAGGDVLGGVDDQGMATLWDAKTGESRGELDVLGEGMRQIAPSGSGLAIAFSPDGERIAVGGGSTFLNFGTPAYQIRVFESNPLRLIGANPLRLAWEHAGRGDMVGTLAFSPDGKTLAQGGPIRGRLRLWDVETGDLKRVLTSDRAGVYAVAFSSDGKLLAAGRGYGEVGREGRSPGRVTIWDAETGANLRTLDDIEGDALALAFAPGSHEIACGGRKGEYSMVRLWDADSGALRWTWNETVFSERLLGVRSLAFSPDGKSLAVCDGDRVRLIDAASGEPRRRVAKSTQPTESK